MAMPLYDNQPTRRAPVVTYTLVAINVVIFLITPMASLNHRYGDGHARACAQEVFSRHYGAIPKELIDNRQQPLPESTVSECHPDPFKKTPWLSALSAMFLHASWDHLLGNMIFLFIFGAATEGRFGRGRYLLFYLASGFVAAYGFALTYPDSMVPLIGASGAIAGVLGSHFAMYPRSRVTMFIPPVFVFRLPAWAVLGQFFVLQWASLHGHGESQTAYVAHIYGFVAGVIVGLLARRSVAARRTPVLSAP
ncbi:MAG TPA: rhomboid family intramembrane serine protease [Streptosporangiaceae bacterium]|jgi:membrane associated rhomboid family serine protease